MVPLDQVEDLLRQLVRIRETVESRGPASIKAR
jgi:hypothetical protein